MASLNVPPNAPIPSEFFSTNPVVIYFFIGRLNPPHEGHEVVLRQLIHLAMSENSIPLILAGNGNKGEEKTLKNPLDFATKKRVLKYRLDLVTGSLCEIREKKNPVADLLEWTEEILTNTGRDREVVFKLITGDKDDNSTKLDSLLTAIVKFAISKGIRATGESHPITAIEGANGVEMSATKVRKDALRAFLSGDGSFHAKYSEYYGPHTDLVYGQIAEIASRMPREEVEHYIHTGELPKKSARKRTSKNGAGNRNSKNNVNRGANAKNNVNRGANKKGSKSANKKGSKSANKKGSKSANKKGSKGANAKNNANTGANKKGSKGAKKSAKKK